MSSRARQPADDNDYDDIDDDEEYDEEEAEFDEDEVEFVEEDEEDDEEEDEEFDGQVEEVEESEDEEEVAVQSQMQAAAIQAANSRPWTGIQSLPEPTRRSFSQLLQQLKQNRKNSLTVLLLGKSMMGKSSTANSLFNEQVAPVTSFQQDTARPQAFRRTALGFELTVIDTPGLLDGDTIDIKALKDILQLVRGTQVDAVLFLDRLDFYRVEKIDQEIMAAITDTFGSSIWNNTIIGLTHGKAVAPQGFASGKPEDYMQQRVTNLQKAMQKAGAGKKASLPVAYIENSSHCATNTAGEKVIGPNRDRRWLPELMTQIVSVAESVPAYAYSPKSAKKSNPNKRKRWLIPFVMLAQIALKKYVLDPIMNAELDAEDELAAKLAFLEAPKMKWEDHKLKKNPEDIEQVHNWYHDTFGVNSFNFDKTDYPADPEEGLKLLARRFEGEGRIGPYEADGGPE